MFMRKDTLVWRLLLLESRQTASRWRLNARIIKIIEEAMKDKSTKEKVERSIRSRKELEAKNSGGEGKASTNPTTNPTYYDVPPANLDLLGNVLNNLQRISS